MLYVKTYVDKSLIKGAGCGLFAQQNIKRGQLVWNFEEPDIIFKKEDIIHVSTISPLIKEFVIKYGFIQEVEDYQMIILSFDNDRFINHSTKPNLDDTKQLKSYAMRDIKRGEELLSDYGIIKALCFTKLK